MGGTGAAATAEEGGGVRCTKADTRPVLAAQGGFCACCKTLVSWRKAYLAADGRGVCVTCKASDNNYARCSRADDHDRPHSV